MIPRALLIPPGVPTPGPDCTVPPAPHRLESAFITQRGLSPFIDPGWVKDQAAYLDKRSQHLLEAALSRFQDQSLQPTEEKDGRLRFTFDSGGGTQRFETGRGGTQPKGHPMALRTLVHSRDADPCIVEMKPDSNGMEIIEIEVAIARPTDPGKLVLRKPGRSTAPRWEGASTRWFQKNVPPAEDARRFEELIASLFPRTKCGGEALTALRELCNKLLGRGYSRGQLSKVAPGHHGRQALQIMLDKDAALRALELDCEDIAHIAAKGGMSALNELLVKKERCASKKDLVSIAAKSGGANALKAFDGYNERLEKHGFTHQEIIDVASSSNSAGKLERLAKGDFLTEMKSMDFSLDQIALMAKKCAGNFLDTVYQNREDLKALEFTPEQIIGIGSHRGGSDALKMLVRVTKTLRAKGLRDEHIRELASEDDACKALAAVLGNNHWEGKLQSDELCKLLSHRLYPNKVLEEFERLRQRGWPKEEILSHLASRYQQRTKETDAGPSAKRVRTDKAP